MFKHDAASGKYFFTGPTGKVFRSANMTYLKARYADEYGTVPFGKVSSEIANTAPEIVAEKFSINERFEFISDYTSMIADKSIPSMILSGAGGLGKTFTVNRVLVREGLTDVSNLDNLEAGKALPARRFRTVKGYTTPKSLFRALYECKDSILILDDCDSAISDNTAANLLKGALDSGAERIISWNSEMTDSDLPRSFRFTGSVIFITNLNKEKIPQALRTRAVMVDVQMTIDEKLERMAHIVGDREFMPEANEEVKKRALDAIRANKDRANEVSMRSLIQVVRIAQRFDGEKFEKMSRYALTN